MATWEEYSQTMVGPVSLTEPARENDVALLSHLLERGAEINARDVRGYSALMLAAYQGLPPCRSWPRLSCVDPHALVIDRRA